MEDFQFVFISKGALANICATGCAKTILAALPYKCAIPDRTLTSLPVLWDISPADEVKIDCQETISELLGKQLLHPFSLKKEQYFHEYVLLERYMREELASLFTLASIHHGGVALDDPVIWKRIAQILPGIANLSTLTLLHDWYKTASMTDSETQYVFSQIVQHAHFQPPESDPLYSWWNRFFYSRGDFALLNK